MSGAPGGASLLADALAKGMRTTTEDGTIRLVARDAGVTDIGSLERDEQIGEVDIGINSLPHLRWVTAFPKMTALAAFACNLESCAGVENARALERLSLQSNRIGSASPVARLRSLRHLRLDDNAITDIAPLASLANLRRLDVSGNGLTTLRGLRLPRLETLRAARNRLSALGDACGCAALEELDLSSNPLTTLAGIRGCRSLESLSLSDCGLVDGTLESLGRLPALTELLLADNSLTSAALPWVTKASTRLVVLDLSNNALEEDEEAAAADAEAEAAAAGARVDAAAARAAARSGPAASLLPALAPLSLLAELARAA
ncbi:hypothetical protein FNF29_06692 [Cafeteria roenbergensis]|uniref:Uncharacterized protein n=1 Tax=Cafeteria roenbergensis TaxID=33653 RepID=A0A5A8C6M2_CAFRO|nr:hypothetical protein FNF29_06692 [Cafeteria roenbergensis]|eukprot:KAA0148475.1 hypothetical protein FNF29_06692 [Cafeteria roenbergensis]